MAVEVRSQDFLFRQLLSKLFRIICAPSRIFIF